LANNDVFSPRSKGSNEVVGPFETDVGTLSVFCGTRGVHAETCDTKRRLESADVFITIVVVDVACRKVFKASSGNSWLKLSTCIIQVV
jgi:hypothetical protein